MEIITANAARVQRHRQRKRGGLVVFSFEGDEIEVPEILIEAGFLDPNDVDDREKIFRALTRWFDVVKKEKAL